MQSISQYWAGFQVCVLPHLEEVFQVPITGKLKEFVEALELVRLEDYVEPSVQKRGRKRLDRCSIARSFLAKSVYDLPTTQVMIEMLHHHTALRRLCGFVKCCDIPSAATFSRAFSEFALSGLGERIPLSLIKKYIGEKIVMHISRDSTAVEAREKPVKQEKPVPAPKGKRGRPKKGEEAAPKEPRRLEIQLTQSCEEAVSALPQVCTVGAKKDSHGNLCHWRGWKAHIDWGDGGVPLNVITTSASLHDSQAAIPMSRMTAQRVHSCYDLMDAAYDAKEIKQVSLELGHVPIIDANKRRGSEVEREADRVRRYNERTTAERGNSRMKDQYGFRHLRVRGHAKAHMHIMFGILALFASQIGKIFSG